jgi:hypothetical protein
MTAEDIKQARTLATWPGRGDGKPEPSAKSAARKVAKSRSRASARRTPPASDSADSPISAARCTSASESGSSRSTRTRRPLPPCSRGRQARRRLSFSLFERHGEDDPGKLWAEHRARGLFLPVDMARQL